MKKLYLILIMISAVFSVNAQVNFDNNTVNGNMASAIGINNTATGDRALAFGENCQSTGANSTAIGYQCTAGADGAISIGIMNEALSTTSLAIGRFLKAESSNAMVIGRGVSTSSPLYNYHANSLAIGFQSDIPTFFVGGSSGPGTIGKVGIGTTTPASLLDINGTLNVEEAVTMKDDLTVSNKLTTHQFRLTTGAGSNKLLTSNATGNASWSAVNDIVPWTKNNGRVYVTGVKVGIGTSSPQAMLSIADNYPPGGKNLEIGNNTFFSDIDQVNTIGLYGNQQINEGGIKLGAQGPKLYGKNGNLGIGTTNPEARLCIQASGDRDLQIGNDVYLSDINNANTLGIYGVQSNTVGAIKLGSNGPKLYGKNGKLGIGTTNPQSELDVNGKITTEHWQLTTGAGNDKVLTSDANGNASWVNVNGIVPESIWSEDDGKIYVESGSVGIGTSNPVEKFQIGDRWTFHNGGSKIIGYNFNYNGGSKRIVDGTACILGFSPNGSFSVKTAPTGTAGSSITWTKGIYLSNDGMVGIGTTNPSEALTIRGNIKCEQIEVVDNVPASDFVFEKDYSLMSLPELETYVNKNHHLPEIPSAADFKANGYNMNDMDDLLLRKVEELTLYIIAQQKLIDKLLKDEKK